MSRTLLLTAAAALLAAPGAAQDLDDLQDLVRESLGKAEFASVFAGFTLISEEQELSTGIFDFDDLGDSEVRSLAFPMRRLLRPWGEGKVALRLEGVVGYARAEESTGDIWLGALPGAETAIDAEWTTWGGVIGLGPEFELGDGLTLATIANAGLAHVESEADYAGPGAAFTSALLDGIAFNWDAVTGSAGGAARLDWRRPLGERHELELVGRYDVRWTETIVEDDAAQDFTARTELLTARADVVGPTGLSVRGRPLGWRATGGYQRFLEGDFLGVDELFQVGGALELELPEEAPLASRLKLQVGTIFGQDVRGWILGLGFSM